MSRRAHITVTVKDENIEKKLRQFKKKIEREGIIKEAKAQVYFESPSVKRRKKKLRAVKMEALRKAAENPSRQVNDY
jgi:small subunit ribosomal protein S21